MEPMGEKWMGHLGHIRSWGIHLHPCFGKAASEQGGPGGKIQELLVTDVTSMEPFCCEEAAAGRDG